MAGQIRIRAKLEGDVAEVKALMRHPMETGQRKDSAGNKIPAHFITQVIAKMGDKVVLESQWGAAVSQNPFLSFRVKGAKAGDTITVEWLDNKGETDSGEAVVK
ncbi:thiosulfate oxidation carrier complex protein SoxZ [Spongiibacter sp. KMU-158]|uniref:Thiosulfate oxidation carrier complex protein SoxZ n=1 Tax=Spongiibacter pelagi TaxID=2760804 RepID=A0A927C6E3_9GAMM|nr:thiosulfate oxidation carrier complex protein SoxZ [Spongiibacter pelagi]MBD2860230.1 thiosulfate oxidation carrier complex protein SoxZ [Spongiibacter pelagi]